MDSPEKYVSSVDNYTSNTKRRVDNRKKHVICIVPNCKSSSTKSNLKFFKFPKDDIKSQNWITSIGLLQNEIIKKNKFVCQRHFLVENITSSNRLTRNAVPFLNIIKRSNTEKDTPVSINSTFTVGLESEMVLTSTPLTQTNSTQTEKDDEEIAFLKLIDKINCHNCQSSQSETYVSQKSLKKDRIINLYKTKFQNTSRKYKLLQVKYNNIRRSLARSQIKIRSLVNIDDHIEKLDVNDTTKSVCKLLVKKDFYYNESDKLFAQSLFYKSASTYKYLRDQLKLKLPSTSSIYKWSPIKFITPGINKTLISQLAKVFQDMSTQSKICVLSFDEICIKKDLTVNIYLDRVEGFCDDGRERKSELATSALFFMLRGLVDDWKYVLNYILINNSTSPARLSELINNNIRIANDDLKLNVVMVTCDQAATNISTFKILGVTHDKPYFLVDEHKIFAQFDPPHLLKSARNAFLTNQIQHSDFGISDINVIRKIFEYDSVQKVKLMPKLTKIHFEPNSFQKMNVKRAAQMMSNTVSSAIRTTLKAKPEIFSDNLENAIPTIHFIQRFNDLFDCMNCRHFGSSAPYEKPLKIDNNIYKYLEGSLIFLDKLKIISKNENYFKFINGLKTSINAQLQLVNHLQSQFNIEYVLIGRTNQDCLENFFSLLRGKGGYNFMPSSHEIGVHFANIVVRKITLNSPFRNCISDEATNIDLDWSSFKAEYENSLKLEYYTNENTLPTEPDEFIENAELHILKDNAIVYYAGYCIFKKIKCDECKLKLLKEGDEIYISDTFLSEKNFKRDDSSFGSLKAPSEQFCQIARSLVTVFEKYYHLRCNSPNLTRFFTDTCLQMIKQEFITFLPDENNACFEHIRSLIQFFILVLINKQQEN